MEAQARILRYLKFMASCGTFTLRTPSRTDFQGSLVGSRAWPIRKQLFWVNKNTKRVWVSGFLFVCRLCVCIRLGFDIWRLQPPRLLLVDTDPSVALVERPETLLRSLQKTLCLLAFLL